MLWSSLVTRTETLQKSIWWHSPISCYDLPWSSDTNDEAPVFAREFRGTNSSPKTLDVSPAHDCMIFYFLFIMSGCSFARSFKEQFQSVGWPTSSSVVGRLALPAPPLLHRRSHKADFRSSTADSRSEWGSMPRLSGFVSWYFAFWGSQISMGFCSYRGDSRMLNPFKPSRPPQRRWRGDHCALTEPLSGGCSEVSFAMFY